VKELSIAPLSSRILQRLPGAKALEEYASESTVLCKAENQYVRPAIFLPGELGRITGVHDFSAGLEDELNLATRNQVAHTATIAWRLQNVYLVKGQLCNYHSYKRLTFGDLSVRPVRVDQINETVAFCSSNAGNDYFAHFLLDDATTAILGQQFGRVMFGGSLRPRTSQMLDYMNHFRAPFREVSQVRFRDVWIFTDHPQNSHRRTRMLQLQSLLCAKFRGLQHPAPAYIRRGHSGTQRILENETQIESLLESRGFRIIDPETMTTDEICAQLSNSPLVIGVEGSHLVHGLINLRPGGGLLCIQPESRFNAVYRSFCHSLNLDWGFTVAEGAANHFRLPIERLNRAIDQMQERVTSC
jgi:hypothetical protein